MCPTDKAANNIAFICKKYFVEVILKELGLLNTTSNIPLGLSMTCYR